MDLMAAVMKSLRENMKSERELDDQERSGVEALQGLYGDEPPALFFTVGVYNNDSFKTNYVREEDLADHIAYNIIMRPGRAFYVNFVCLNRGYLGEQRALEWQEKLSKQGLPEMRKDTRLYH